MGRQANYPCRFKCQFGTGAGVQGARVIAVNEFGGLAHLARLVPGDVLLNFSFTAKVGSNNVNIAVAVDDTTIEQLAVFEVIDSLGGFFSITIFSFAYQQEVIITAFMAFDFDLPNADPSLQGNPAMQGAWRITNAF